jgi:hypothetical protein
MGGTGLEVHLKYKKILKLLFLERMQHDQK